MYNVLTFVGGRLLIRYVPMYCRRDFFRATCNREGLVNVPYLLLMVAEMLNFLIKRNTKINGLQSGKIC